MAKDIEPNQNNLEKHMGKHQIKHNVPNKGLKNNQVYYEKNNKHFWNLVLFAIWWPHSFLQQVSVDMVMKNCHKNVQFATLFNILQNRWPWLNLKLWGLYMNT